MAEEPNNQSQYEEYSSMNQDRAITKPNSVTSKNSPDSKEFPEKSIGVKTSVILLGEAPAANTTKLWAKPCDNRRVIELSDKVSKMELRRQFKVDVLGSSDRHSTDIRDSDGRVTRNDETNAEILSRLPPGTILIKQSISSAASSTRSQTREDSDYVHDSSKDSTSTHSSGSSNASYPPTKVKRMQQRAVRNKKIVEVRRNPARNKKKKLEEEDCLRPRQRLLAVKRKAPTYTLEAAGPTQRGGKSTPTPYMNTRSVTRKMYTVGATYQAPTIQDSMEWKEWPTHGMHERPIWHPQVGLAFEYIDRNFVSLDGESYREIVDGPVIEVVAVDPHPERMFVSGKRKFGENQSQPSPTNDSYRGHSFETCMHRSLHSVLAYCAQVATPTYKKNVDMKLKELSQSDGVSEKNKMEAKTTVTTTPSTSGQGSLGGTVKRLVVPRRTINFKNVRNLQGNILQEVFGRSTKNTLIFLKPTEPVANVEKIDKINAKTVTAKKENEETAACDLNLKLEDNAISDEVLMEMSSIYKKLLPNDEPEQTKSIKPADIKRCPVTAIVTKKSVNDEPKDNSRCMNQCLRDQATEIAKILSDYNKKAAKNSGLRTSSCSSTVVNRSGKPGPSGNCNKGDNNRVKCLSMTEQPKIVKVVKEWSDDPVKQEVARKGSDMTQTVKVEGRRNPEDDIRAIDLRTAKFLKPETEAKPEESNRQWFEKLIEDTALLYCAAAGVHQDDVADYLNTLDSKQSMEWLGS